MTVLATTGFDVTVTGASAARAFFDVHSVASSGLLAVDSDGVGIVDSEGEPLVVSGSGSRVSDRFDVTVDGTLSRAALAVEGHQVVTWRVLVDDVEIDSSWLVPEFTVTQTLDGITATIGLYARCDLGSYVSGVTRSPYGDPLRTHAPPMGQRRITIEGGYVMATGVRWVPLITDGIVDSSQRANGVDTLSIIDSEGRYDRVPVSTVLPPGHGTRRDRIIQARAEAAGSTSFALEPMSTMQKEIQSINQSALSLSRELAEVEGRAVFRNPRGELVNPRRLPESSDVVAWDLDETRILTPGVSLSSVADVPTRVCLTGTQQVIRDCGRRVERQITEVYGPYTPRKAAWSQGGSGALTVFSGAAQSFARTLISRITTEVEFECDILLSERVLIDGWHNPQAKRYTQDETSILSYLTGVYLYEETAVQDDLNLAYQWHTERFGRIAETLTTHHYDDRLFQVGSTTTQRALYLLRSARESASGNPTVNTLGDGTGISGTFEELLDVETQVASRDINDDGYIEAEAVAVSKWFARPGAEYTYLDGRKSRDVTEGWYVAETARTQHQASSDENTRRSTIVRTGSVGELIETRVEYGAGYLPAAEKSLGDQASRYEVQNLELELEAPWLLADHVDHKLSGSSIYAENLEELHDLARFLLRDRASVDVPLSLPAHFLLTVPSKLRVRDRGEGCDYDLWLVEAQHQGTADSIVTSIRTRKVPEV